MQGKSTVYEIVGNWKGAISIDTPPNRANLANDAIRRQYGITDSEIVLDSVQQALTFINNGTPFTNANPLTDAFVQRFNAALFGAMHPADPTLFRAQDAVPQ